MDRLESIDAKIQEGYTLLLENDYPGGCDKWLEAWEDIKPLFAGGVAADIDELDKLYEWTQYISNYAQDLELELHNAGCEDKIYHKKRAVYCEELLQWCGSDELLISNTRRAMAEACFESGDEAGCDRLFEGWLRDDPDWALGYLAWADCYRFRKDGANNDKVEEILLAGHSKGEPHDRIEIVANLMALYEDTGRLDKAKELEKEFRELHESIPEFKNADRAFRSELLGWQSENQRNAAYDKPAPVRVAKTGRNEPCPCGSGKKFKKCCGA